MSPPAMKCLPAPRTTTQRTLASAASAAVPCTSASIIAGSRALSASGRLSVSVATAPPRSTRRGRVMVRMAAGRRALHEGTCDAPAVSQAADARSGRSAILRHLEWARRLELLDGLRDFGSLVGGEARDRAREIRIGDRVRRARCDGKQAAGELVDPLGAALEGGDPPLDAEVDRLVITGLEVHPGHELGRSPVAAPEGIAAEYVERGAQGTAFALADHEQHAARKRRAQPFEELERQIRRGMMPPVGGRVAAEEERPVALLGLAAD